MLPFLKKDRNVAGVSVQYRTPDESKKKSMDEDDTYSSDEALEAASQDIIDAVSSGDKKILAKAIKAAFEICDSMPHVEGEHISEE